MARRGHGEGSIYRRQDGRWAASLTLETAKRKTFYGKTRKEVQQKLTEALRLQQQARLVTGPQQTVGSYLEHWLHDVARVRIRPKSAELYEYYVRQLTAKLGPKRLTQLRPADIQLAYRHMVEDDALSPATIRGAHAILHQALKQAVAWDYIVRNPVEHVTPPALERREMRTLSQEEVQTLFTATDGDRWHALWVLLVSSGLRVGEALGLKWDDIDFSARTVTVRRQLQRQRGKGNVLVDTKTKHSRRTISLTTYTCEALRAHRALQGRERLAAGPLWNDNGFVFSTELGDGVNGTRVWATLQRVLKAAGLPRLRVHDLRHTTATLLLQLGVNPRVAQEMLGHASVSITLETYSHVMPGMRHDAVMRMDELLRRDHA